MTCRRIRLMLLPLLVALPIAGCGGGDGAGPGRSAGPSAAGSTLATTITVVRTGGLAGVTDRVTVEPTGHWLRTDRVGRTASGDLTPAQLTRLGQLASDPRLRAEASATPSPGPCRDTFTFTVTVDTVTVSYPDCPGQPTPQVASSIVKELADTLTD